MNEFKMVPVEPTKEMIRAAIDTPCAYTGDESVDQPQDYRNMYAAMVAAAPGVSCPGHGRSECVSCCWPKGEWNGYGLPPIGLPVEAYFPQDTQPVWLKTTLLYVSEENVIYADDGEEIRKTRDQFDDLNVSFRKVQS